MPFLCLRRGVSSNPCGVLAGLAFSLPTQRCFLVRKRAVAVPRLFSAYAEVFLSDVSLCIGISTFLCLRRGVSPSGGVL